MCPLRSDPALCTLISNGILKGLSRTYVDGMLHNRNKRFKHVARDMSQKFMVVDNEHVVFTFTGFHVCQPNEDPEKLETEQHGYIDLLSFLTEYQTFPDFASLRVKLILLSHTDLMTCMKFHI